MYVDNGGTLNLEWKDGLMKLRVWGESNNKTQHVKNHFSYCINVSQMYLAVNEFFHVHLFRDTYNHTYILPIYTDNQPNRAKVHCELKTFNSHIPNYVGFQSCYY